MNKSLDVECSTCGAPAGVPCRTMDGSLAPHSHFLRAFVYHSEEEDRIKYRELSFIDLGDGGYMARPINGAE